MSFELGFIVSFITAGLVSFFVASVCETPLAILMRRIIQNDTSRIFTKYVRYATCLVGISHGVDENPLYFELMAHILERDFDYLQFLILSLVTIVKTLAAIAAMYLVLFIFGLIAYITIKAREN